MRGGQQCLVRCESRFAYGPDGCPATRPGDADLPPNADIELRVELLEVLSNTAPSNMTLEEALEEGQRRKVVGNELFARKAYKKALRSYTSAHNAIAELEFPNHDSDLYREAWQFRVDCGNNIATTCVRMGELKRAKDAVVGVLELDPVNVKALYRAGQICSLESNFVEAKLALRKALNLNPESKEVKAELRRLSARVKACNAKTQAMHEAMGRSMFGGVKGERQVVRDKGSNTAVGASAALEVPKKASAAQEEAQNIDVRRAGADSSEDPERKPVTTTLALERCQAVSVCVLVALAAWGITCLVAR